MANLGKLIGFNILLITISSINAWTRLPIGNTFFWWAIYLITLIIFLRSSYFLYDTENNTNIRVLVFYLAWNVICIIRGFETADNYWEWKNLVGTSFVLLLPISIYAFTNTFLVQQLLFVWFKYALPAFVIFVPFFSYNDAYGRYLVPVSFILLFFRLLPTRWKIIALVLTGVVIFGALDARSNVIKFSVALLFGFIFYFRKIISLRVIKVSRLMLLSVPIVFFVLGVTGKFDVFRMDQYVGGNFKTTVTQNGKIVKENLAADTRTLLYQEVLASAIKYNYFVFGRTPARGNESHLFGMYLADVLHTGKMERFSNEVSILNVFTWTGIIGVVLYFLVFYRATYLAIFKANSFVMRIIGLYVAFRWCYAWVEDFSDFDLSYLFLWIQIGMCFSNKFRKMNDQDFKIWIMGVFKKYPELVNKVNNKESDDSTESFSKSTIRYNQPI